MKSLLSVQSLSHIVTISSIFIQPPSSAHPNSPSTQPFYLSISSLFVVTTAVDLARRAATSRHSRRPVALVGVVVVVLVLAAPAVVHWISHRFSTNRSEAISWSEPTKTIATAAEEVLLEGTAKAGAAKSYDCWNRSSNSCTIWKCCQWSTWDRRSSIRMLCGINCCTRRRWDPKMHHQRSLILHGTNCTLRNEFII